jgi:predicted nucleotide-binding protein
VCTQQRRAARYNIGVKVFISHNDQDKETARLLAMLFTERGIGVWFDEWQIKPGESITGGFGKGIEECNVFVLLWSAAAKGSRWVDTDVRAAIR